MKGGGMTFIPLVLILVLMEDALVLLYSLVHRVEVYGVLILVLMEDALVPDRNNGLKL